MDKAEEIMDPLKKEFIRLLTDFGFKRVFGSKEHAGILLRFLNALFEGEMTIEKIEFKDKEILPTHIAGKRILYDIYCTTDRGEVFILEMQQEESENFTGRILFYSANAIVQQGVSGVEYDIDPVYCIVLTNFNLSGMKRSLVKDILLIDRHSREVYSDQLRIIFISLKEVPGEWDDCNTQLLKLLYLIKNMEDMTRKSKPYLSGEYDDIFTASSIGNLTNEEAQAYSNSYFKELDNQSAIRFAESRGRQEGELIGRKEGELIGRKEGRKEGRQEGELIGRREGELIGRKKLMDEILKKARLAGLSDDMIASLIPQ